MNTNNLQPVDIASLKNGDKVYLHGIPAWHVWFNQYDDCKAIFREANFDEEHTTVKVQVGSNTTSLPSRCLYYPPNPQPTYRPIDLATIKEGIPVIIRQKGSEWDKREGKVGMYIWNKQRIQVCFGEEQSWFSASIVFHVPEQPAPLPEKPFEVAEEVVTKRFDSYIGLLFLPDMQQYVGVLGKIKDIEAGMYFVHGYWWPASALERVPVKKAKLKPVDVRKLSKGDRVKMIYPENSEQARTSKIHSKEGVFQWKEYIGSQFVHVLFPHLGKIVNVNSKYLFELPFMPVAERVPVKQEQPVLIELEKVKEMYSTYGFSYIVDKIVQHFSRSENQYHLPQPEEQPASPEAMVQPGGEDKPQPSFAERIDEYWKTQGQPFTLTEARQLYQQGGLAADVAKRWYSEEELTKRELPMSWEELQTVSGCVIDEDGDIIRTNQNLITQQAKRVYPTRQDAEAALSTAQLLQLQQAWLEIECPDWVPDWINVKETKYCIVRQGNTIKAKGHQTAFSKFSFPKADLRDKFLAAFRPLLLQAFCLPADNEEGGGY